MTQKFAHDECVSVSQLAVLCVLGAASAHRILAQPGSMTGSIGVALKSMCNLAPALKKAGVDVDFVNFKFESGRACFDTLQFQEHDP